MTVARVPEAPIFVIGSPRSGTTLLRLMLTSHPCICIPPECGFIVWLNARYGHIGRPELESPALIEALAAEIAASRKFETWNLTVDQVAGALREAEPANFADACAAVYRRYANARGKPEAVWGDKNNYYVSHVGELHCLFGNARFVHIVRDGRDVACSYREVMRDESSTSPYRPSLPVDIKDVASRWSGDIRSIRAQLTVLAPAEAIELRYEDLVEDPQRELARLCDRLGIEFSADMLSFHERNRTLRLEPEVTMDWKRRTLQPANAATVGRYRNNLTADEIRTFLAVAGAELAAYGYPS